MMLATRSFKILVGVVLCVSLCTAPDVSAQDGASSASASRTRYLSSLGQVPRPVEFRLEEIINYHRHRIPLPKSGQAVALDLRWGNSRVSRKQPHAVLQIGLATSRVNDLKHIPPVNLCLVIDKSGSMAASDKMTRVKEAMRRMIRNLQPRDIVSIVTYDNDAAVACPARKVGDGWMLLSAIERIHPGGSTNLHAGLMLGFREAKKNFSKERTNRVILLTDGIANTGVVDPARILADSLSRKDDGIDLSTIGVGRELNRELLRKLSSGGRGLNHFVADAVDIQKVFDDELQSLLSPVARQVKLTVHWDKGLGLTRVFGYEPTAGRNKLELRLDDMNHGLTQVVMMRFRAKRTKETVAETLPMRVTLSYFDPNKGRTVRLEAKEPLGITTGNRGPWLMDPVVRKNFWIARMADTMKRASADWWAGRRAKALQTVQKLVHRVEHSVYPGGKDQDILRNLESLRKLWRAMGGRGC